MMTAFWCLQVNGGHSPGGRPYATDGCSRGADPSALVVSTGSHEGVWKTGVCRMGGIEALDIMSRASNSVRETMSGHSGVRKYWGGGFTPWHQEQRSTHRTDRCRASQFSRALCRTCS